MKLLFKKNILSNNEADRLIEKYYEGLTSVAEEKKLQQFLSQQKNPNKYAAEKAMFAYLKPETKAVIIPYYMRYAAAVAVLLISTFSIQNFMAQNTHAYAYVDGKKITDKAQITAIAKASIREVSDNNEVEEKLQEINNSELVEKQLEVFSNPENNK
jgi:hypothetical protein